ncbi:STN domain-containing protein [Bradyrhizobium sp. 2TAF24]|uniref:STN domain-containing protein n=1 Tax=Bradyrhizobium sp. 2TAF24 TaxID=3233011 RepID=UPI003F8DD8E3
MTIVPAAGARRQCRSWQLLQRALAAMALLMCGAAVASPVAAEGSDKILTFDIASQPLEDALYAFSAATGIEVFADGDIVKGRQSTAVRGTMAATPALQLLLAGTGLDAHAIGTRAITLSPAPPDATRAALRSAYSAQLQRAALRQLCGNGDADLGSYRVALQLWLDDAGTVRRAVLLSSTGDETRDRRIHDRITRIFAGKPPSALPQPVVMVILPRRDGEDCTAGMSARP